MENAEIAGKSVDTQLRKANNAMETFVVEKLMVAMGAMPAMAAPTRHAVFVSLKGHKEAQYFEKNLEKAPAWWEAKQEKNESSTSSVEVKLALLSNTIGDGVKVTAMKCKKHDRWQYCTRKMCGFVT